MESNRPILFYDGLCAFCNFAVRFVAKLDRNRQIYFAPIQSTLCEGIMQRHPKLRAADTAFLVDFDEVGGERVAMKSAIAEGLALYVPFPEKLILLPFQFIPRKIGDWLYDIVARNRNRLFRRYESCPIPPKELRDRFMDAP